jgi:hypothetical protein
MKISFTSVCLLAASLGTLMLSDAAAAPARPLYGPTQATAPVGKPPHQPGDTVFNVSDTLGQNDGLYQGRRHRVYEVELQAGKTYQIDMKSTNFDSYLFFESPTKQLLAQDDDSGGYPDARIIYKATQNGKFRVIASHFGNGGNLGQFNITVVVTRPGAALPVPVPFKN